MRRRHPSILLLFVGIYLLKPRSYALNNCFSVLSSNTHIRILTFTRMYSLSLYYPCYVVFVFLYLICWHCQHCFVPTADTNSVYCLTFCSSFPVCCLSFTFISRLAHSFEASVGAVISLENSRPYWNAQLSLYIKLHGTLWILTRVCVHNGKCTATWIVNKIPIGFIVRGLNLINISP